MRNLAIGFLVFVIGVILFMDEIWMVAPELGIGTPGWLIGDFFRQRHRIPEIN